VKPAHRVRQVVNAVNLSTPTGLLLALVGARRPILRARHGLLVVGGYRLPLPDAPAFTMGNVILVRGAAADLLERDRLFRHEERHSTQYAYCLGPVMVVAYLMCAGASLVMCGDPASYNPFERLASLDDGGYVKKPMRRLPLRRKPGPLPRRPT
jgi:hypothetical protein